MIRHWNLATAFVCVFTIGLWLGLMAPHLGRKPKRKSAKKDSGPTKVDYWFSVRFSDSHCSGCNRKFAKNERAAKLTNKRVACEECAEWMTK